MNIRFTLGRGELFDEEVERVLGTTDDERLHHIFKDVVDLLFLEVAL
jgi:hypothetical protein